MKNHSKQNLWESKVWIKKKKNYREKLYKAEEKIKLDSNLNSRPREIQVCEEWLDAVAENSISQWKNSILHLPLQLGMVMWPSSGNWDIISKS